MNKTVACVVVSILILGTLMSIVPQAKAEGETPTWKNGNYWEFRGSGVINGTATSVALKLTMIGKAQVTVGASTYETNRCKLWMNLTVGGTPLMVQGDYYFRASDMADVKIQTSFFGQQTTITYDPPLESLHFPLSNGSTWSSTSKETTVSPQGTEIVNVTYDFQVSGPTNVTVHAGTFNSFNVTMQEHGVPANVSYNYFSSAAGNAVRMMVPGAPMGINFPLELWSLNYQPPGTNPPGNQQNLTQDSSALYVAVIIIVAVVVVVAAVLVVRSRRKARMPPPQQPQGPTYGKPPDKSQYQPPPQP